jgi:hypothetical protein
MDKNFNFHFQDPDSIDAPDMPDELKNRVKEYFKEVKRLGWAIMRYPMCTEGDDLVFELLAQPPRTTDTSSLINKEALCLYLTQCKGHIKPDVQLVTFKKIPHGRSETTQYFTLSDTKWIEEIVEGTPVFDINPLQINL